MELNVLYFAHVRALVGQSSERLECPEGSTVGQVAGLICERHPSLSGLMGAVRVAVNGEFARQDDVVPDGAEFVLIPPVAGGSDLPRVALTSDALDTRRVARLEAELRRADFGALVTFTGVVRNHARGQPVERLLYEAYESMALSQLERLVREVESEFEGTALAVHHRVGLLEIGETAVAIVAGSAHRAQAFDACRRLIDRIKEDVPIWKCEYGPDGEEWVSDRP